MSEKTTNRGIYLYINGEKVKNDVKSIQGELSRITNEQRKMIIGSEEYAKATEKIKALKGVLKDHRENLKETSSMWDKVKDSAGQFFNRTTAGVASVAAIGTALMYVIKHSMEFGKAVSELSAITGATGKDLDYLRSKAKDMGAQFGKSATEIVTAMKLVGSAKPELLTNVAALSEVTGAVITLSKAAGLDLTVATNSVTTIMNQFGLSAVEAERTVNVLAAGSKYGAKEVDYLGEAISKVGTVANAAGISLEATTAAMELFGEKGVQAETAGNGFKRILVELQSDAGNFTNGVFDLNKAIERNTSIAGDNVALSEKFGKEYFTIAQILLQNKERFEQLTQQVTGTTTAEEQMAVATDNLSGDIDKLTGAWDRFLLKLEDGKGPLSQFSRWLTQISKDIIDGAAAMNMTAGEEDSAAITTRTNAKLKDFKQELAKEQKNKVGLINEEITKERELEKIMLDRLKKTQSELKEVNKLINTGHDTKKYKDQHDELQKQEKTQLLTIYSSRNYRNQLGAMRSTYTTKPKPDGNWGDGGTGGGGGTSTTKNALADKFALVDQWQTREENRLRDSYEQQLMDRKEFDQKMRDLTLDALLEKQKIAGVDTQEGQKIKKQILELWDKEGTQAGKTKIIDTTKELAKVTEEAAKKLIALGDKIGRQDAQVIKSKGISVEHVQQFADQTSQIAGSMSNAAMGFVQAEEMAIDRKYKKMIKAAGKNSKQVAKLEEDKEKELAAVRAKWADKTFILGAAQIVASTALAAINAYAAAAKIDPFVLAPLAAGAAGVAGMAQLAVANQQREQAKAGYKVGGYTPWGNPDDEAGVVHRGEFVANNRAVRNPQVRPFLDLIDYAQRSNTIANLTREDIRAVLSPTATARTTAPPTATAQSTAATGADISAHLAANAEAIARLNEKLDKGINAYSVISGNKGVKEQLDRYNQLVKNASR